MIKDPITLNASEPQKFAEAISYFRKQAPWISGSSWATMARLSAQKGDTVSGAALLSMVDDVWKRMDTAVAEGEPYSEFVRKIGKSFRMDWVGLDSPRLKLIYHNNVGSALMAGRMDQILDPDVVSDRPYILFDAIEDMRTTPICLDRDGIIRPATDSWWRKNTPLLHHNCRSSVISLDGEDMKDEGGLTRPDKLAKLSIVPKGWGSIESWENWRPEGADYHPALYREYQSWRDGQSYARELSEWRDKLFQSWGVQQHKSPDFGDGWVTPSGSGVPETSIKKALELVNRVHGDGGMQKHSLIVDNDTDGMTKSGWYDARKRVVALVSDADQKPVDAVVTSIHEMGHAIDHFLQDNKPQLRIEVLQAIKKGRYYLSLKERWGASTILVDGHRYRLDERMISYLISDNELMARTYAQYISVKNDFSKAIDEMSDSAVEPVYPEYCHLEEFKPVQDAYDRVFEELKWLRMKGISEKETEI